MTAPGYGKQKGAWLERKVCTDFSLWVSRGKREDIFWRSAMSGGRATRMAIAGRSNRTQLGDITAIDPLGEPLCAAFYIECKFYKDLQMLSSLIFGVGKLREFWIQTYERAVEHNRSPLLVCRQNSSTAIFILTNDYGASVLGLQEPQVSSAAMARTGQHETAGLWLYEVMLKQRFKLRGDR